MRKEFQKAYHALLKGVVTIKVKFEAGGRLYTYRALESDCLQAGDTVVIRYRDKFFTTEVVEVDRYPDFSKDVEYKWIVCKVDEERYENFLDQEAMFEQQMLALSAKTEVDKVKSELVEQYGEENVGYLASIAQGKVQTASLMDVIELLTGGMLSPSVNSVNGQTVIHTNGEAEEELATRLKQAAAEGAEEGVKLVMDEHRIDWASRYNKYIAGLHNYNGITWRDFMVGGLEDKEAVRRAKMMFDRFKRKNFTLEDFKASSF
ncbi:hypothetical protein OMDBNIEC_00036 [Salmonella phage STP-SP5]|nr:hypothetical protein OMDBNIEC_00036 [Salmonella phage STP-SP5]